jgi:hypothetical protein
MEKTGLHDPAHRQSDASQGIHHKSAIYGETAMPVGCSGFLLLDE